MIIAVLKERVQKAVQRVTTPADSADYERALSEAAERARQTVAKLREARQMDPEELNRPFASKLGIEIRRSVQRSNPVRLIMHVRKQCKDVVCVICRAIRDALKLYHYQCIWF